MTLIFGASSSHLIFFMKFLRYKLYVSLEYTDCKLQLNWRVKACLTLSAFLLVSLFRSVSGAPDRRHEKRANIRVRLYQRSPVCKEIQVSLLV